MRLPATAAVLCLLTVAPVCCRAACGDTEEDRIVWARERMHSGASKSQLDLIYRWLVNGTSSCNLSGDLWYYRSLVARQLNDVRDAAYSLRKAEENRSNARTRGFDPFLVVPHTPPRPVDRVHDKWALLIGVGTFQKSDDFLEFSVKDARDLGKFLVESGNFKKQNVTVLADKDATTANIREAFGEIRAKAKADDMVLVYISSHGQPRDLDPTGLSYVLTYDTDTSTQAKIYATGLQMVELAELGRWILANDYVLLLDTCFSGAARPGGAARVVSNGANGLDPLQGLQGSGNRAVISASRADERSYEDPDNKHGFFTRFLLDGLRQQSSSGSLASLFEYVNAHVSSEVGRRAGREQHPVEQFFGVGNEINLVTQPLAASLQFQIAGSFGFGRKRYGFE